MKKNNSGCIIWILIILAIAGVAWVRYLLPLVAVFIIIAVVNGVENKKTNSSQGDERERQEQKETSRHRKTTSSKSAAQSKTCDEATDQTNGSEQKKHTKSAGAEDYIITCDYCGCRIETSKYNTCPHCGGPYWDNEQWKEVWRRKMS